MANLAYPKFFEHLMKAEINFQTAVLKVAVMDSSYTFSLLHEFKSSLSGILATGTLAGIVFPGGVFDADDTQVNTPSGPDMQLAIYVDTGVAGTSPLFVFFDTGLNFGITPTGNILIIWPNDTTIGIFPIGGKA